MKVFEILEGWEADLAKENRQKAAWAKTVADANKALARKEREGKKAAQVPKTPKARLTKAKMDDFKIFNEVSYMAADSFPHGDPFDKVVPWLKKNGLEMSDVDAAFKKQTKKNFYGWLAQTWEDAAQDAIADAKMSLKQNKNPDQSDFYYFDQQNNKIIPEDNPWK